MEELVEIVNRLQDVFLVSDNSQGVNLPQIVVVGTQSSGKSSVLEHLVGKSFLPRGTGVVTRCPIVLQMVHAQGKQQVEEYAIFQHNTVKVFTDDHLISKEIATQTERLAGSNKGICQTPIILKMYSPSFLDLTIIDLPGLTKVPVGDQPADIERQTRDLIMRYIENPNCIILAVTPANADMATSESLKISREVDPEGLRTLAVVTKLDLMDEGTDALDMLTGKIIPVKLGIIGVVNRSQKDIADNKSLQQSLKDEAAFFYRKYRSISATHGSPYLKMTVQTILIDKIKDCLPSLRQTVNEKLSSKKEELKKLGERNSDKPALLLELITKFSTTFCSAIKGDSVNIQTEELYGGSRINYVFQESLAVALGSIDALAGLTKVAILTAMQNASGANPALFIPEVAFKLLVKKQMKRLRNPCLQCIDLVHVELSRIVQNCVDDPELGLRRYPTLQSRVSDVMSELLRSGIPNTVRMVNHFIDIQLAYINTAHPDFLPNIVENLSFPTFSGRDELSRPRSSTSLRLPENALSTVLQNPKLDRTSRDCALVEELIKSYFSIVRKTVQDTIPKTVMHFLVNFVEAHAQSELVAALYKDRDASELLRESQAVTDRRRELEAEITDLEQATAILNSFKPSATPGKNASPRMCCLERSSKRSSI